MDPEEREKKEAELDRQIDELTKVRDAEQDKKKKGALTRQINDLLKEKDSLSGDGENENDGLVTISARHTTGREKYRRAGINFTDQPVEYRVSEKVLERLLADKNIKLSTVKK